MALCVISLYWGVKKGNNCRLSIFRAEEKKLYITRYTLLGIIGCAVFCWDYIRLNGVATEKIASDISIIGSVGSLFVPILLVLGLYMNAYSVRYCGKLSVAGIIMVLGYSLPCMLNAGREAVLFGVIGILSIYGYSHLLIKNNVINKSTKSSKKVILLTSVISILMYMAYLLIEISQSRFSDNEISVLLTYRDVSSSAMLDAEKWGTFQFLYYNISSYFSHQLPFLDFTLREYDGPYLFGMYEFNIISRRLPDFMNLDYKIATQELHTLFNTKGESFAGGWNTVLGSFIIDFTWVGAIIGCSVCGYFISIVKRKFMITYDPRYMTLLALFCLSTFSTIQLGPFFQTQIYGCYVWWYLLFRKEEKVLIS